MPKFRELTTSPPQWELGGLSIDKTYQGRGLASALVRFAIAHTMAFERPWKETSVQKQPVVAHVHRDNNEPRALFNSLGFVHNKSVSVPGNVAPRSMKRDESGNVHGDELKFTGDALIQLSAWFNREFTGSLAKGDKVVFGLGEGTLGDLKAALSRMEGESPE